jgi:hypothetical protein
MPGLRHFAFLAVALGILVFVAVLAVARPVPATTPGPPRPAAPRSLPGLPLPARQPVSVPSFPVVTRSMMASPIAVS